MAMIDSITVGNLCIIEVDADPTISGVTANIGDLAILNAAANKMQWRKIGEGDTNWKSLSDFDSGSPRDKLISLTFSRTGNPLNNTWLRNGVNTNTNQVPSIIPFNCKLVSLVFSNRNDEADLNIEFYKNGLSSADEEFVWELRNAQNAHISNFPQEFTYQQGDRIAVRVTDEGENNRDVWVMMFLLLTDDTKTSGGNQDRDSGGAPTTNQIVVS